jgi:hypothetical protein
MAARGTRSSRSEALLRTPPLDMTGGVMAGDSDLRELLRVCDRSLARLRSVPAGTERPIYQNLQAVRDRTRVQLAALGTRPQTSRPRYVWCEGCDRRRGVGDLGWVKIALHVLDRPNDPVVLYYCPEHAKQLARDDPDLSPVDP